MIFSYLKAIVNKASGTVTPGTGSEVYTGGLFGYAYYITICKCTKDESGYSENGKKIINGCPDSETEYVDCGETCPE